MLQQYLIEADAMYPNGLHAFPRSRQRAIQIDGPAGVFNDDGFESLFGRVFSRVSNAKVGRKPRQ